MKSKKLIYYIILFLSLMILSCSETGNNVDFCKENPCEHDGICKNESGGYTCECKSGYSGLTCEVNINECKNSPCVHGVCRDEDGSYSCSCDAGYNGKNCDNDVDDCKANPCVHGTCTDGIDSYTCECEENYRGKNCDEISDLCLVDNGGCKQICNSSENNEYVICSCNDGYELNEDGLNCDDIDECLNGSAACLDDEYCVNTMGSFDCMKCNCNTEGTINYLDSCDDEGKCDCNELFDGLKCEEERHLKIFVTQERYTGDMDGIGGADMLCNSDENKPDSHYYKALLGSIDRDINEDWPLESSLKYYRADGIVLISQTNVNKWFSSDFDNSVEEYGKDVWTGLRVDGRYNEDNCHDWTFDTAFIAKGSYGNSGMVNIRGTVRVGNEKCEQKKRIYCIEQICPNNKTYNFQTGLCE